MPADPRVGVSAQGGLEDRVPREDRLAGRAPAIEDPDELDEVAVERLIDRLGVGRRLHAGRRDGEPQDIREEVGDDPARQAGLLVAAHAHPVGAKHVRPPSEDETRVEPGGERASKLLEVDIVVGTALDELHIVRAEQVVLAAQVDHDAGVVAEVRRECGEPASSPPR